MIARSLLTILSSFLLVREVAAIDAAISYATFQSPDQAYVELYIRVSGESLQFVADSAGLQKATATIHVEFFREGILATEDRFQISSPPTKVPVDFIALERYSLPAGQYDLRLALQDAADPNNAQRYRAAVTLDFLQDAVAQSDINLLARLEPTQQAGMLVRNGLYMEPLPGRYYGPDDQQLYFYHEIYHSDRFIGQDFVVTYAIEALQNGQPQRILERHKRQTPEAIIPLTGQLDVTKLPSGLYTFAIELRNAKKRLLGRKIAYFQRSNPGLWQQEEWLASFDPGQSFVGQLTEDSLAYSLRALNPKLPPSDMESVNWILKQKDFEAQRAYLFAYWSGQVPTQPETQYRKYMEIARAVDQQFRSGFRYGFETDRGYIYLKYGRPTDIESRENEPSAPPYEIWTYDVLETTRQNNVRFVFYNPSLAPGDYLLLHSTARGEIQQPQWQRILYKNAPGQSKDDDFLEGTEVIDNFHRSSRRIFGEGGN